jgi:L-rhamnonate dehydratase
MPKITKLKAYVLQQDESGADYHRQKDGHWIIDTPISNPMSIYEQYRKSRLRFFFPFFKQNIPTNYILLM